MSDTDDPPATDGRASADPPWNDDLQDLRRRAEIFRRLAEKSPVPVVLTRFGTSEILFTNTEADRVFDTGTPGARKMALDLYEHPSDREVVLAKLRADGAMRNHAVRLRRRDGSIGDYLMSMIPTEVEGDRVLYTYVLDISARVAAEQALQARSEEMGLILDNVTQGLLIIAADGVLLGEHSAVVDAWLGRISAGETLWAAIARGDAAFAAYFEAAWSAVTDEVLPLELALDQLPRVMHVDGRHLQIACQPIGAWDDLDRPERYLVILSDISETVARERAEAEQRDLMGIFERLLRDREGVVEFLAETDRIIARIRNWIGDAANLVGLKRDVHTLKGNCALFGVHRVAAACHALESALDEHGEARAAELVSAITAPWDVISQWTHGFLEGDRRELEIEADDLRALRAALTAETPHAQVLRLVEDWQHPPTRRRLQRIAAQAKALARRLGKGDIAVETEDNGLRLPVAPWAAFWAAFGHVLRNAVDHGLEAEDERRAAGKPAAGSLRVRVAHDAAAVVIEMTDDGRGIDWERIRARAVQLGLPASSQAELEAALFSDGVTTRDQASDTSGRGVGAAAVKSCVEAMGGQIVIRSALGAGTTFRFTVPVHPDGTPLSVAAASSSRVARRSRAPLGCEADGTVKQW